MKIYKTNNTRKDTIEKQLVKKYKKKQNNTIKVKE